MAVASSGGVSLGDGPGAGVKVYDQVYSREEFGDIISGYSSSADIAGVDGTIVGGAAPAVVSKMVEGAGPITAIVTSGLFLTKGLQDSRIAGEYSKILAVYNDLVIKEGMIDSGIGMKLDTYPGGEIRDFYSVSSGQMLGRIVEVWIQPGGM